MFELALNGTNSYLFVNGKEIRKFKAKDSEILATPLCFANISKDWSVYSTKRTGFSVDYDAIAVDDILDIHKYLLKKNNVILKCLGLLKKRFLQD